MFADLKFFTGYAKIFVKIIEFCSLPIFPWNEICSLYCIFFLSPHNLNDFSCFKKRDKPDQTLEFWPVSTDLSCETALLLCISCFNCFILKVIIHSCEQSNFNLFSGDHFVANGYYNLFFIFKTSTIFPIIWNWQKLWNYLELNRSLLPGYHSCLIFEFVFLI